MKCRFCGAEISEKEAAFCPHCGARQTDQQQEQKKGRSSAAVLARSYGRKPWFWAFIAVIIVAILLVVKSRQCSVDGCHNIKASGSQYCSVHKCSISSCGNKRTNGIYCSYHYTLYSSNSYEYGSSYSGAASHVSASDLNVWGIKMSSSGTRDIAEGSLTNNSNETVKFVKIKGAFMNHRGKVIDTASTYAVGSEGLAPGETTTWRMSVKKDDEIYKCEVTVYDFDY